MEKGLEHNNNNNDNQDCRVALSLLKGVQGIQFYKVVAGGDGTLCAYAEAAAADKNNLSTATQVADRPALYTQFLA